MKRMQAAHLANSWRRQLKTPAGAVAMISKTTANRRHTQRMRTSSWGGRSRVFGFVTRLQWAEFNRLHPVQLEANGDDAAKLIGLDRPI